jgi:dTDP-4-amino-4,6-dideoxygalactose transaminase
MMQPIYVTQPFLPPLAELLPYLEKMWRTRNLTNGAEFHVELEAALTAHLGVANVSLFNNGTLALVTALQALRVTGEVITTPFSFVATAHSLVWNGIEPVFVDIDRQRLTIDPERIEAAITPRTTAILAVHVYGRPCHVEAIQAIADRYGLKVIYDAAHAFDVQYRGESLLRHGDLSILSFHATKVYNTFEGGAIVSPDQKIKQRIDFLKNFGFADELTVVAPGINAKMNEFQAALGLAQLAHVGKSIQRRTELAARYTAALSSVRGIGLLAPVDDHRPNHSYFAILVEPEFAMSRDGLYEKLKQRNIFARRYFYPLISSFPMYRGRTSSNPENLPVAMSVAAQILCLPIYPDMSDADQDRVIQAIVEFAA